MVEKSREIDEKNFEDIRMLKPVYEKFKSTGRISIVDKELSCTQLKYIISKCKEEIEVVEQGEFGADMKVELLNDGPFTVLLDSDDL